MNPYMPLTGNDCSIPTLMVSTLAPLHELHASALFRIQAVTQMLESFALRDMPGADYVDLRHISHEASILLRDGCDLLDVLGRRLQAL